MPKDLEIITYKGREYMATNDVISLAKRCNDLSHFIKMLDPDSEEFKGNLDTEKSGLSDFNKKLVKGLNFNPKEDKNHFEMREFPIVGVLNDGTIISNENNPYFNKKSSRILACKSALSKRLSEDETSTIYVVEKTNRVFAKLNDGKELDF